MSDRCTDRAVGYGGRQPNGQFSKGNKCSSGNPQAKRQYEFRSALLDFVDLDHLRAVWSSLVAAATSGDVQAAKVVLDFATGKPTQTVAIEPDEPSPEQTWIGLNDLTYEELKILEKVHGRMAGESDDES